MDNKYEEAYALGRNLYYRPIDNLVAKALAYYERELIAAQ
jgi:hypothetical protein